jgi:hypothetical protein
MRIDVCIGVHCWQFVNMIFINTLHQTGSKIGYSLFYTSWIYVQDYNKLKKYIIQESQFFRHAAGYIYTG